jgi:hypothetical protein
MVAVVSAACSYPAWANTGKVDFAIGNVTVTGSDGLWRPLTKGAEVRSGDRIVSSVDGRAQIRFSDGAYVSLQPNSEFDIKEYRFDGKTDGKESALFGLFKGAMRTVTGLVGGVNRSRYQISTPTATVGIRGTGGLIAIGGDGSTLVTGTSGIWLLANNGGMLDVPAGKAGFAGADVRVPPHLREEGPVLPPPQSTPELPKYVQGDVVDSQGRPVSLAGGPRLQSGPGYAVAYVGGGAGPAITSPTNAVFDSSGQLTQFDGFTPQLVAATFALAGTQMEAGTDGVLAWGRWTGLVQVTTAAGTSPVTLSPDQGLHYVAGLPTPAGSMPQIGSGIFTYTMIGATSPTLANGSVAPGAVNPITTTLTGNFMTAPIVSVSLNGTMGGTTFSGSATGLILGSTFSPMGMATIGVSPLISCSGTCGLNVAGFFSGNNATHAGFQYQIGNVNSPGGLTTMDGAVALKR